MRGSRIASEIDREYKLKKIYEIKKKNNCTIKLKCSECKDREICQGKGRKDE
jgi:radical SAM protein with 4Fe4S-binding SPASM domain